MKFSTHFGSSSSFRAVRERTKFAGFPGGFSSRKRSRGTSHSLAKEVASKPAVLSSDQEDGASRRRPGVTGKPIRPRFSGAFFYVVEGSTARTRRSTIPVETVSPPNEHPRREMDLDRIAICYTHRDLAWNRVLAHCRQLRDESTGTISLPPTPPFGIRVGLILAGIRLRLRSVSTPRAPEISPGQPMTTPLASGAVNVWTSTVRNRYPSMDEYLIEQSKSTTLSPIPNHR